jgi:predicted dehydrogenase
MHGRRLDIGVIGCGKIAQAKHLPYLQKLSRQFHVRALSDRDPQALRAAHARFPMASVHAFHEELLEETLDAVLIATNGNHLAELLAASAKGCHIFVEKPLCLNVRDAERAAIAIQQAGIKAMVGYMKRHAPGVRWAMERFREAQNPRFVQCTLWQPSEDRYLNAVVDGLPRRINSVLDSIRSRAAGQDVVDGMKEDFGSRLALEDRVAYLLLASSLIHDINLLRSLLGEPMRVLRYEMWNDGLAGSVLVLFPRRVVASLTWVFLAGGSYHERFNLIAEQERIEIDFSSPYLHNSPVGITIDSLGPSGELRKSRVELSYEDPFELELKAFHEAVCGNGPIITSFEDAVTDLRVIRDIFRAMSSARSPGETHKSIALSD